MPSQHSSWEGCVCTRAWVRARVVLSFRGSNVIPASNSTPPSMHVCVVCPTVLLLHTCLAALKRTHNNYVKKQEISGAYLRNASRSRLAADLFAACTHAWQLLRTLVRITCRSYCFQKKHWLHVYLRHAFGGGNTSTGDAAGKAAATQQQQQKKKNQNNNC